MMKKSASSIPLSLPLAIAGIFCVSGCSLLPQMNARLSGDRIFITRLPAEPNGNPLRLAVKDNIDVKGVVTTAGSGYLAKTRPPATKDAPCMAIARERRVQIVGKTNLSEFAVSPSGLNEHFGTPRNPFCIWGKRIPGGSSCGSAVAIAADVADVAFGTDTAGSIRVPAACCGIVGLKTTHGLIPIEGVHPIEPKYMDTVGPMGKDIASVVVGMDLLERGFMAKYAAAKAAHPTARTIRVGRLRLKGTDPKTDAAIDTALLLTGFQVVPLDPSLAEKWEQAKADGNTIAAAGAWISDGQYQNTIGVSLRTKAVILTGRLQYSKYDKVVARRAQWQAALQEAFKKVDFIALPTLQKAPFNKPTGGLDAGLLEARMLSLQNTVPVNFAGNPALACPVPLRRSGFVVASLQLVGPDRSEAELLNAGRLVEAAVFPSNRGTSYTRLASGCSTDAASHVLRGN
jgi:amidase